MRFSKVRLFNSAKKKYVLKAFTSQRGNTNTYLNVEASLYVRGNISQAESDRDAALSCAR